MKIAVVGGNGFIGKEFVTYALDKGHKTIVLDRHYDIISSEGSIQILEILRDCDAMVFLAARRPSISFSLEDYFYNIEIAGRYLDLCRKASIGNIVITSSISVYSSEETPWKEDHFDIPLSLYGASKQAVDSLALQYNHQYHLHIKCLRLAQVIGMGERKGFLLNTVIDNAITGKKQTVFGKGIGRRQYIYVKDVCDVILHCIEIENENAGIFNIAMHDNISIVELVQIANEVFGNETGIEFVDYDKEDTKEYLMDTTKAEKSLHWRAEYDFEKALKDIRDNDKKILGEI